MSIDQRIREGLRTVNDDLPVLDVESALATVIDRGQPTHRRAIVAALAAAAAVAAGIAGLSLITDDNTDSQHPGDFTDQNPSDVPAWEPLEPLRPAASRVQQYETDEFGYALEVPDQRDVTVPEIDIVSVAEGFQFNGGSSWRFRLAARAPRDPAGRVIAYGVVVDRDGDHEPDCQIGINNNTREDGDFYVWVTNLRTHETVDRHGPPYGMPVEFAHPAEEGIDRSMSFGFLRGLSRPDPCDPLNDASTFYVWSSVTDDGQVVARDYAPNAAWLPIRFEREPQ